MSEIFDGYERQYCELSKNISRKAANAALINGEQRKEKMLELKNGMEEAESLIRRMDLEARTLPTTQKAMLLAKLREYKADLTNLKREVKKAASVDSAAERDELLESGMGAELTVSGDQRTRLLSSTAKLDDQTGRIMSGKRTLLETEELGVSILQDLHKQRETLLHARDTLHGVDDGLGRARQVLTSMGRRMNRNKWVMGLIIAVLLLAICLVIFAKFRR